MRACRSGDEICVPDSTLPRIVIVGGGFAGIAAAKAFAKKPVQVILLDRNNFHQFQPLLYQVATSGLEPDSILFPLRKLFKKQKNVTIRIGEVISINPGADQILTDKGLLEFDVLIIATGSANNFFGLNELGRNALGMKTVQEALCIRSQVLQNLEKAVLSCDDNEREACTTVVIVGSGPAGVEVAGALAEFRRYIVPGDYPELDAEDMRVILLEAGDQLLPSMSSHASENAEIDLRRLDVDVRLHSKVSGYDGRTVTIEQMRPVNAATVIWTAGVQGEIPAGLDQKAVGKGRRFIVNQFNQVQGYPRIFAVGDVASMNLQDYPKGHPMVAQVAIQQGRLLGENILHLLNGSPMKPFMYKYRGTLATIGKKKAVADQKHFHLKGFAAWFIWSFVHLFSISGFRNKLLVAINWCWSYLTYEKGNRLIIGNVSRQQSRTN